MFQERYVEDYELGAERRAGGRTITETDIVLHASQTGDFYPHHRDAKWCKTQEFGQHVAHGSPIFSVAVGMTAGAVNPLAFSHGYDRLRFVKPVFIGDTIAVRVTIADKREHKRPEQRMVVERCEVSNQRSEVVLVYDYLLLVRRRKPLAAPAS